MAFVSSIIVVEDIARSRGLYEKILGLRVTADFGIYNVGFEGGLSLYRKAFFQELIGGAAELGRTNNFVLYFEVDDLEAFERTLRESGFTFLHGIREQPWKQRTFRAYDFDNHLLEIAERMDAVVRRLRREDHTLEEIAQMTGLPAEEVAKLAGDGKPQE